MKFDPCEHKIRQIAIKAAIEIRKARGLPEETNITVLFDEVAPILGIINKVMSSKDLSRLPAPYEMIDEETGKPIIPKRDCPECGEKESMNLHPICRGCADSEDGRYWTMWICTKCPHKEKSEKHFVTVLNELGVDFKNMSKREMGVRTVTDEGLK